MRQVFLIVAIVLVVAWPAAAEQSKPAQEELLRRGAKKITIGTVLITAGLVAMPITGLSRPDADGQRAVGACLIVTGAGFALWGARDRYNAVRSQITFGAAIGRSNAVYVRRRW